MLAPGQEAMPLFLLNDGAERFVYDHRRKTRLAGPEAGLPGSVAPILWHST